MAVRSIEPGPAPAAVAAEDSDLLWERYLDWCSARVATHLLCMPPQEVWTYAQRHSDGWPRPATFATMVQHISVAVFQKLSLPDFPTWRERYPSDPTPSLPDPN